jgi:hypothetical protein
MDIHSVSGFPVFIVLMGKGNTFIHRTVLIWNMIKAIARRK